MDLVVSFIFDERPDVLNHWEWGDYLLYDYMLKDKHERSELIQDPPLISKLRKEYLKKAMVKKWRKWNSADRKTRRFMNYLYKLPTDLQV